MQLHEALSQIHEIRLRMARTETFRGYRAATVAFSALVAIAAAVVQSVGLERPAERPTAYVMLWAGAAALCLAATGGEMALRCRRAQSPWTSQLTWLAVEQFLPCILAGALLTVAVLRTAEAQLWMLPGLWSILFSLGVFASCRLLPRAALAVGGYYLVSGVLCLATWQGPAAFSPWVMGGMFGAGQSLTAAILYLTLERKHG